MTERGGPGLGHERYGIDALFVGDRAMGRDRGGGDVDIELGLSQVGIPGGVSAESSLGTGDMSVEGGVGMVQMKGKE